MVRSMIDGSFYLFERAHDDDSDFNFEDVAGALELNGLQKRLLDNFLRNICFRIWFTEDDDTKNPHFEVVCFWDEFECTISAITLDFLLDYAFAQRNDIGDKAEIAALQNLRDKIDAAIALRKQTEGKNASTE